MSSPPAQVGFLELGFVRRAHGLRGELCVQLHDPQSQALTQVQSLYLGPSPRSQPPGNAAAKLLSRTLVRTQDLGAGAYLIGLAGVEDRDAADALRGSLLFGDRRELEPPTEDEFYLVDLIGAAVVSVAGEAIGTVADIPSVGGRDLLAVRLSGGGEALVPWVPEFITAVDVEARQVTIDPPEGLLELALSQPGADGEELRPRRRDRRGPTGRAANAPASVKQTEGSAPTANEAEFVTLVADVLTLFPEMFLPVLSASITGRAMQRGLLTVHLTNPRDFAPGKHRSTDDTPFGGGSGMVMRPEPIVSALEAIEAQRGRGQRILLTPGGAPLRQAQVRRLAALPHLTLICGRYEGFDERITPFVDEELSLGDFVLTGGEIAALALLDAVIRLHPGVLHNDASSSEESFEQDLLEYPQYTRPPLFRGTAVPEVLLTGNHEHIRRWRRGQSLLRTRTRRPDLFAQVRPNLSDLDWRLLYEAEAAELTLISAVGPPAPALAVAPAERVIGDEQDLPS